MADLSPAAQAIKDAVLATYAETFPRYDNLWALECDIIVCDIIVAALRAAAEIVAPESPMLVPGGRTYEEAWTVTAQDTMRRQLLAIAAELEGQ